MKQRKECLTVRLNPKYIRYIERVANNRSTWIQEAVERRIAEECPLLMQQILKGRKAEEELSNVRKD